VCMCVCVCKREIVCLSMCLRSICVKNYQSISLRHANNTTVWRSMKSNCRCDARRHDWRQTCFISAGKKKRRPKDTRRYTRILLWS
jgi:hypothetical protein